MNKILAKSTFWVLLSFASVAWGHGDELGDISVSHPWMRAIPIPGMNGAGYMNITNNGKVDDRLLEVKAGWVAKAEIHETSENDGMMSMMPLPEGIVIPANSSTSLEPGAVHVMLMKTNKQIMPGDRLPVSLIFEHAGELKTHFVAQPLTGDSHQHH